MPPRSNIVRLPIADPTPYDAQAQLENYQTFYADYAPDVFLQGENAKKYEALVDGRVLHCDEPTDRSIHLFVYVPKAPYVVNSLYRRDSQGEPYCHINYDPNEFMVIATNGIAIKALQHRSVYGIHHGAINGADRPYRPENETMHFEFNRTENLSQELVIARLGIQGTMAFEDGSLGWLLDAAASASEREAVLGIRPHSIRAA